MERDREINDARIEEKKTDDAEEGLVAVKIELGLDRNQRLQNFRVDGEVQHRQVTPVRGEKRFQHLQVGMAFRAVRLFCRRRAWEQVGRVGNASLPEKFFQGGIGL